MIEELRLAYCRLWPEEDGSYVLDHLRELSGSDFDEVVTDRLKSVRDRQSALSALLDRAERQAGSAQVSITVPELSQFGRSLSHITSNLRRMLSNHVSVIVLHGLNQDLPIDVAHVSPVDVVDLLDEARSQLASEKIRRGQTAARAEGRTLGRPAKLAMKEASEIKRRLAEGADMNWLAREFEVSKSTIWRIGAARSEHETGETDSRDVKDTDGAPQEPRPHVRVHPGRPVESATTREGDDE